ncbi:MAG TPA: hypothetical protein PK339_09055 [Flavitalea sp.]|nr:hypothetical protein [Flavitalea sp.]
MKKYLFVFCAAILTIACKDAVEQAEGEKPVDIEGFMDFFPEVSLPFRIADSTLKKKPRDSSAIAYDVVARFIPDSVWSKDFGKDVKPSLYPMGKAMEKGRETYLFIQARHGTKQAAYLACFGKKNEYLSAMPVIKMGFDQFSSAYGLLDRRFQITTYRQRRLKDGEIAFKRNVYIFNSAANEFLLILTEPNKEIIENIINPIDTLARKSKYAGDYSINKKNFISFRDGRNPSELLFFVHFEKNNGECVGELKGTARFVSPKEAVYKENGNPCALQFTFGASSVSMKETEGCGSYRDIKCFFEGTYPKKKEAKAAAGKKKETNAKPATKK